MPYLKSSELRMLEEVLEAATFNNSSFERIGLGYGEDFPVEERDVDAFIRERTRVFRRSWIISPLLRVINTLRENPLETPELIPDRDRPTRKDVRAWEVSARASDEPDAGGTMYYRLDTLRTHAPKTPLYRFASTMRPGDSFTYVSEDALTTFNVKCYEQPYTDNDCGCPPFQCNGHVEEEGDE